MKKLKKLIPLLLYSLLSTVLAQAQQPIIGLVTDTQGEPIIGATVQEAGSKNYAVTGLNGDFSLIPKTTLPVTLRIDAVGFKSQELEIFELYGEPLTINMKLDNVLDEVVVIGYGEVQKKDLTGAVASLSADKIKTGVQVSVDQMLQGRAAGVQISTASSEPGGGISVRIRGTTSISAGNQPLYVIDGLPVNNSTGPASQIMSSQIARNPLNSLNPSDIESIEILKDASATAIYGSRGANGVILITTKKGDGDLKVDYSSYYGVQSVAKKLDVMNAQQYMKFMNAIYSDRGEDPLFSEEKMNEVGKGTNWQDEVLRNAQVLNQQIALSGSSNTTHYYASFNYLDQDGVVISSGVKRYTGRINLSHSTEKFNFGLNLNTSLVKDDYVKNGTGVNAGSGVILSALEMDPTMSVYDDDGNYSIHESMDVDNPVAIAKTWLDDMQTNRVFGSIYAEYEFTPGLKAKVNFGTDRQNARRDEYISKSDTRAGQLTNGKAMVSTQENNSFLTELTLSYSKQFNKNHRLNAVAGTTYQQFNSNSLAASAQDLSTDAYLTNNLSAGNPSLYEVSTDKTKNQLLSYLGRINYSLYDKYLITASFRVDGSSRFGDGNKFGYFPSVALAWRVSDETFLRAFPIVSDLKLRTSYGVTGNQDIGNYQSLQLLDVTGEAVFNDNISIGISPSQLGNLNLKWETTAQWDVGVDFGVWNNRISGTVDYFRKYTSDLLLDLPIPATSGFTSSLQNVGNTENYGFDFSISTINIEREFTWSTTLAGSVIRNKVTNLGSLEAIYQGSVRFFTQMTVIKKGLPLNSYYGYKVEGIFRSAEEVAASAQPTASPGDLKYKDVNGDGAITTDDRTVIGNPFPDFTLGLGNNFSYKNLELSVFFEGVFGNDLMNLERANSETPIETLRNRLAYVQNRWTPDNPDSKNPSFTDTDLTRGLNSRIIEDASFVRLKNVQLSYKIPIKKLRSVSVYASAQNLLTITRYRGYDPDVNAMRNSSIKMDYSTYPLSRVYTLGFNIGI